MFFHHLKIAFSRHTASDCGSPAGPAEIYAKCLHLQEVICKRNTGNYTIEAALLAEPNWVAKPSEKVSNLVIGKLVNESRLFAFSLTVIPGRKQS
jgi:hypothetical protein